MREGWQSVELGSFMEFKNGLNADKDAYGSGLKFVNVMDIFRSSELYADSIIGSVQTSPKAASEYSVVHGDILFNRTSETPEDIACASVYLDDEPITFGGFVIRGRQTKKLLDSEFCRFVFQAHNVRRETVRRCQGAVRGNIGQQDLAKVPLNIPPLPEQRKIATILRTWDEALEKLNSLRVAKELQYRALARKLFDPCHPSFHDRPYTWQEFELGEIFTERSQAGADGERLLSVTMNGGVIDREDVGRKDTSTEDKSRYKLVRPGDIAYNTMRMWQGVSGLSTMQGIVSPAYTVVTPIEKRLLGRYAAHLFKSRRMVFDFERYSQGLTSDTWNLKFPAFSKIKVWLPPVDEQERQADLLDTMLCEYDVLRQLIKALTDQKRGLMQKLLTGEWRVEVSDEDEAAA
jgi:type I restriction enzyme S subunit